jgi:hypothetical protein
LSSSGWNGILYKLGLAGVSNQGGAGKNGKQSAAGDDDEEPAAVGANQRHDQRAGADEGKDVGVTGHPAPPSRCSLMPSINSGGQVPAAIGYGRGGRVRAGTAAGAYASVASTGPGGSGAGALGVGGGGVA